MALWGRRLLGLMSSSTFHRHQHTTSSGNDAADKSCPLANIDIGVPLRRIMEPFCSNAGAEGRPRRHQSHHAAGVPQIYQRRLHRTTSFIVLLLLLWRWSGSCIEVAPLAKLMNEALVRPGSGAMHQPSANKHALAMPSLPICDFAQTCCIFWCAEMLAGIGGPVCCCPRRGIVPHI